MRYLRIIIGILLGVSAAFGSEVSVDLDQCVVLNAENDTSAATAIPMLFTLPNEVDGKEVIQAEIFIPVVLENYETSLYELRLFPLAESWSEEGISYGDIEDIPDSMCVGSFTLTLGASNIFYVDITAIVNEIAAGNRTNYGLVAIGDLLGEGNLQLPESVALSVKSNAYVKILYK